MLACLLALSFSHLACRALVLVVLVLVVLLVLEVLVVEDESAALAAILVQRAIVQAI